jgi:Raf kinase inhibitor-like YbhB/YbcL family protein
MKWTTSALLAFAFLGVSGALAEAQTQPAAGASGPPVLAKTLLPARGGGLRLLVTSEGLTNGGDMDEKYTQNGENESPPMSWSKGPTGTRSYALLVEDAGVNRAEPISHWVIYDLPSTQRNLPGGIPTDATLENGAKQAKNVAGKTGYIGPKPPAGQTHPYHFEVFALNARLNLDPATADRDSVVNAMKGHVLAMGDIVANYTGK